jgi:glycosyltransferase involved in cell wall biosynthesis
VGAPAEAAKWPRITMVTAVYNGEAYLETTIRSIVEQGYPNLEYIIVNDGSTDGTAEIIKRYEQHVTCWFSQPNRGLYAALNAGFARSTGEIMGWLNASDRLYDKGLFVVGGVFAGFPQVEWITGRPTACNHSGMPVFIGELRRWSRYRFLAGANKHIQQESTFWRRSLWEKAGGRLDESYRAEGDFELWVRFFRYAQLYPVNALIGAYRFHSDALSHGSIERYDRTCDEIVARELEAVRGGNWLKLFRRIGPLAKRIPKVRGLWYRLTENMLYEWRGPDSPPVIRYSLGDDSWFLAKK